MNKHLVKRSAVKLLVTVYIEINFTLIRYCYRSDSFVWTVLRYLLYNITSLIKSNRRFDSVLSSFRFSMSFVHVSKSDLGSDS